MQRINGPGATPDNLWTDGDPIAGIHPTQVIAAFQNSLQEEVCGVIEAAQIALSPLDNTQLQQALTRLAKPATNVLTNPMFRWWQKHGFGPTTHNNFDRNVADAWAWDETGAGADCDIERVPFTDGPCPGLELHGDPSHVFQLTMTTVGANYIAQAIPNVDTLAGQSIILSFCARTTSGSFQVSPDLHQNFGDGGSPSSTVVYSGGGQTVTTDWQQFTFLVDLGTTDGKTKGTDGNDHLLWKLNLPDAELFTLQLTNCRLELGAIAGHTWRPELEELHRSQAYFCKSLPADETDWTTEKGKQTAYFLYKDTGYMDGAGHFFPREMWLRPDVLWYSGLSQNAHRLDVNGSEVTDRFTIPPINASTTFTGIPDPDGGPGTATAELGGSMFSAEVLW